MYVKMPDANIMAASCCCTRCSLRSPLGGDQQQQQQQPKISRAHLGIVPATSGRTRDYLCTDTSGRTRDYLCTDTSGRTRDYLCTDCIERENEAPARVGYECPGWKYGRHGYRCAPLKFVSNKNMPHIQSMVGKYDVVFLAIDQKFSPRYHRSVEGTLEFTLAEAPIMMDKNPVEEDENGGIMEETDAGPTGTWNTVTCLRGVVNMDPKSAITDGAWTDGLTFLARPSSADTDTPITPTVPGFGEGGYLSYTGRENRKNGGATSRASPADGNNTAATNIHGQLRIVSERSVVRSRPDSKPTMRRRACRPAIFNTTTEADKITSAYRRSISPWLSSNLGLPNGPASLICDYWTERPSPLFDFLPGDICLTSIMSNKGFMNDTISTVLVARRRR